MPGDRNGNLQSLKGRTWDAVIDTCGFISENVRASAALLADSVGHYTFISSISVYRDYFKSGLDESAAVQPLPAGVVEVEGDEKTYGARKTLCECAAEAVMSQRVLLCSRRLRLSALTIKNGPFFAIGCAAPLPEAKCSRPVVRKIPSN